MNLNQYIEIVRYLQKEGFSSEIIVAIINKLENKPTPIINTEDNKLTSKQRKFLTDLGYKGDLDNLTKEQARAEIKKLVERGNLEDKEEDKFDGEGRYL